MAHAALVRLRAATAAAAVALAWTAGADVRTSTQPGAASASVSASAPAPASAPATVEASRAPEPRASTPRSPAAALDDRVRAGRHWRLDTPRGPVHVWAPAEYDAVTAATVVFVHGYWVDVDEAWGWYRLAQQFALSGINALFIAPEAPSAKWDPIAWPALGELVRAVATRVEVAMPGRRLVAVGHSGAYRTLARWLAEPALDTVVLLDAAYEDYGLLPWLRASPERRLVNIAYETGRFSSYLHRQIPGTVRVDGLPPGGLPDARVLYVRTEAGHWPLVTDGVALPLALRAIAVPAVGSGPLDPVLGPLLGPLLGLPPPDPALALDWLARPPFAPRIDELPR